METLTPDVCDDEALANEDDGADFAAEIERVAAPIVRDGSVELMATMVVFTQAAGRGNVKTRTSRQKQDQKPHLNKSAERLNPLLKTAVWEISLAGAYD